MQNESKKNLKLYFFKCKGTKKYIQSKRALSTTSWLLMLFTRNLFNTLCQKNINWQYNINKKVIISKNLYFKDDEVQGKTKKWWNLIRLNKQTELYVVRWNTAVDKHIIYKNITKSKNFII